MRAKQPTAPAGAIAHTGDLATTPFAELLVGLLESQKIGTLRIADERSEPMAQIRFDAGTPVAARIAAADAGLMQSLIPLCARSEGNYLFVQGVDELGQAADIVYGKVDPLALIAAAMRGPVREDAVQRTLARLGSSLLKLNPRVELERYALTMQERQVTAVLKQTPGDLMQLQIAAELPAHITRRLVYVLAITRGITVVPAAQRSTSGTIAHAPPLPSASSKPPPTVRFEMPTAELLPPEPAPAPRASAPGRSTMLEHGGRVAADGARARRSRKLAAKQPSGRYHVQNPSEGLTELPAAAVELGLPRHLPPALQLWCKEILDRGSKVARQSYYELLEIERDSREEQITAAYDSLAKRFDPNELPEELAAIRDQARVILDHAMQALQTLRDPQARRSYDRDLDRGELPSTRPALQRGLQAEAHHRKAEGLLKRKDYGGALVEIERAIGLASDCARYEALYGYLLFLRSGATGRVHPQALQQLQSALKRDPGCEQAHYYKAMLLKHSGKADEACAHFQRALKLNPNHVEAAHELRLLQMRRKPSARPDR